MKNPYEIVVRPLLTEKSTDQAAHNKYHFQVERSANKVEIAQAVAAIYAPRGEARVLAVNTMTVKGKKKRAITRGGKSGYSPTWKKAIVTTDRPLTLFEGV
ncbi:MAG TPA: 50S ribosomal protein L23 [Chthonomonadales bacterium]|nr:50S ribosomal protein L23 [Chthonomonadales bacterium]